MRNYSNEIDLIEDKINNKIILNILESLPEYRRKRINKILKLRYSKNMTYEQIAKKMNLSRERIRQIEERTLRRLRVGIEIKEKLGEIKI